MSGELNRINPTVVEGAEDIFGADDRLIAAGSKRPGFWSSRVSGNRTQLTPAQLAKFQRQNKFKKSARANASRAESFEGQGCGCGGGNCQCAENFEARTYRKSPSRGKTPTSRGKTAGKERRMRQLKQGYNDKMDESMGKGKPMKASRKDRRDESKGMEKSMGNRAYSRVKTMDAEGLYECGKCNQWNRNPISGVTKCKKCGHGSFDKVKNAESFGADSELSAWPSEAKKGFSKAERDEIDEDRVGPIYKINGEWTWCNTGSGRAGHLQLGDSPLCGYCGTNYASESFGADSLVVDENMVDLGSVDAFYGGGVRVPVSGEGITPTENPSVDEAFNVGNKVGIDNTEQQLMNVNPSVDANYGAENKDIVGTVQNITDKVGFRVNGWLASAVVVGIAGMAGYRYAKR